MFALTWGKDVSLEAAVIAKEVHDQILFFRQMIHIISSAEGNVGE